MGCVHREVFFAHNGAGPYHCHFCGGDVAFAVVVVHHLDEDPANNMPDNLVPAHQPCHVGFHSRGRPSPRKGTGKKAARLAARSRNGSPEHRAKLRAARVGATPFKGRTHSRASRERIGAVSRDKAKSAEHRARISASVRARYASAPPSRESNGRIVSWGD